MAQGDGGAAEAEAAGDDGSRPEAVVAFWLEEVGPQGWYAVDPALDERVRARFAPLWNRALEGRLDRWLCGPEGTLAYLLLTDQFPRNMWRDRAEAFASDRAALRAAKAAIDRDWDLRIPEPARQFFYLPLMHSEHLADQDRCVRLILTRMPETGASNLLHAKAHREVIRRFGRFPHRNAALGRSDTPAEAAFLAAGGYGAVVREMQGE